MLHSNNLDDTRLWQVYAEKTKDDPARMGWTKEVCNMACTHLKAVRDTFDNYTLHDEKHVLNVLDAMAGLLGKDDENLSTGEAELLILVAALHDLGMIYTAEDRKNYLTNKNWLQAYCSLHPELRNTDVEDWDDAGRQNYFRWLHPFRVGDVLEKPEWRKQFDKRPMEVMSKEIIIAVCRAHGETPEKMRREAADSNGELKYNKSKEVDPLFCAILLRLADILDFDDSRAPSVLFSYAGRSEKSVEEWKKHQSSMGFTYPKEPSSDNLPYYASFTDPNVERSTHAFLDWIDDELANSRSLLTLTHGDRTQFLFPFQVDRTEVERIGYDYGDFKITMDQDQIMNLLTGENLYSDRSVFIRELLQNSIDATLLRAEMDESFASKLNTDEARIDLWEWWDNEGDLWFRIDDNGSGMTRGMLEKYFLKAGNSYYNSQEFKRDLNGKGYSSISRFGIGFLSSFLCGDAAYVSTKYWDSKKNKREADTAGIRYQENCEYGLRLDVKGVTGYYTLKNQAISDNRPDPLPAPPVIAPHPDEKYEKDGYRALPGTSIAIKLDAGKLGTESLREVAKKWVCFPRMPIYYNDEPLCMTQDKLVEYANENPGSIEHELSDEEKREFDEFLPELKGDYPKIIDTIKLFEADKISGLPKLKIILCQTKVLVSNNKQILRKGYDCVCTGRSALGKPEISLSGVFGERDKKLSFKSKDERRLFKELSNNGNFLQAIHYGWKGIFVYHESYNRFGYSPTVIIIDEDKSRPVLKASREYMVSAPLGTVITTAIWLEKHFPYKNYSNFIDEFSNIPLKDWRAIFSEEYLQWLNLPSLSKFINFKAALEKALTFVGNFPVELTVDNFGSPEYYWTNGIGDDIRYFFLAYLQLYYRITVNYSNKEITFCENDPDENMTQFDLFPLMAFGYGETEEDCSIICHANFNCRVVYTANHPFMEWLLKNADKLYKYYPRQFEQIIKAFRYENAGNLINTINQIIDQLSKTASKHGINMFKCPRLKMDDFWYYEAPSDNSSSVEPLDDASAS